jgi:hypothetical protein
MDGSEHNRVTGRAPDWIRGSFGRARPIYPGFLFFGLVLSLLFPYRIEYNWAFFSTISVLDIALIILFSLVVIGAFVRGGFVVGNKTIFIALIMPVIFAILSLMWSVNAFATMKSIVVYGAAVVVFLLTIHFGEGRSISQLGASFVSISFVLILVSIVSYFPGSPLRPEVTMLESQLSRSNFLLSYNARMSHPFLGLSNNFATILAMLLPIVLFVRKAGVWRRSAWLVAVLLFAAIIATGSRGVLLAVVTAYALAFAWKLALTGRMPGRNMLLFFIALIVAALFFLLSPESQKHVVDRLSLNTVYARLEAYFAVIEIVRNSPWGIGPGVALSEVSEVALKSVHNAYLQNLLWFGWFGGLLINLTILALPFLVLLIPVHSKTGREAKRSIALSITILLIINLSQASWEGSLLRVWIYFIVGLGLVMIKKVDRVDSEQVAERIK